MNPKLLNLIVCPSCKGDLACHATENSPNGAVWAGTLHCEECARDYPIVAGIPRFVPESSYASSFGFQWNQFRQEQLDSASGITQSANRLLSETGWDREWLAGKWILDVGCGAGRFLDAISGTGCEVVGVDLTNAVDAARENLSDRPNVHLVQASIYELPFRDGVFDGCYCIGVIQHTPDPDRSVRALPRVLKVNGRIAVTIYERKWYTMANAKYLVRPVTKRLSSRALLRALKLIMPVVFPITEVLFRLPLVGRGFRFLIPVADYAGDPELTLRQRYQWAILDTFDMLSPRYDQPQRDQETRRALSEAGISDIKRLPNAGLNLVGSKVV